MVLALRVRLRLVLGATSDEIDDTVDDLPRFGGRMGEGRTERVAADVIDGGKRGRVDAGNDSEDFNAGRGNGNKCLGRSSLDERADNIRDD